MLRELTGVAEVWAEGVTPPGELPRWHGAVRGAPQTYYHLKLSVEWLVAAILFVLISPLILVLAALVKMTSPGPAFYAQTRLGRFGRPYKIFKLRTMVHDAELKSGPVWAKKNDDRITALGSIMRKTHLDELPQLWNILRCEMSLIGPRPERPEIAARIERFVPEFRGRLLVRPGVTGLAQMLLPADDPNDHEFRGARRKVAHDLYYVRHMCVSLDVRIALCTVCYFIVAGIDSLREMLVRSYGTAVDGGILSTEEANCEQAA